MRDHLPPGLPPDPFADDPCDPSAALDALEPGQPLDPQERIAVEADLADLAVYEALLAHKGIRGLVVCCDECQQDHYHDWDMLRANLLQLLVDGTVRPHEPAYDPEPDAYVTWDYCRGYADASLNEATYGHRRVSLRAQPLVSCLRRRSRSRVQAPRMSSYTGACRCTGAAVACRVVPGGAMDSADCHGRCFDRRRFFSRCGCGCCPRWLLAPPTVVDAAAAVAWPPMPSAASSLRVGGGSGVTDVGVGQTGAEWRR